MVFVVSYFVISGMVFFLFRGLEEKMSDKTLKPLKTLLLSIVWPVTLPRFFFNFVRFFFATRNM